MEVRALQAVDLVLRGGRDCPAALQHHPDAQVDVLSHPVDLPPVLRQEEVQGQEGAPQDQEGQAGVGAGLQVPGELLVFDRIRFGNNAIFSSTVLKYSTYRIISRNIKRLDNTILVWIGKSVIQTDSHFIQWFSQYMYCI